MSTKIILSQGTSFVSMLAILFIGLRLTEHIAWSWWWVLAPLWVFPAGLVGAVIAGLLSIMIPAAVSAYRQRKASAVVGKFREELK